MNKCFLVLLLVFVSSCRDYADVVIDNQGTSVEWYTGGVDSVTVTPWRVGKYRKQLLSMGARIKIELPAVKGSDIELLSEKYDVDSWLITLMVSGLGRKEKLASFYVPLFKKSGRSGAIGVSSIEMGYLDLFYSAAAISTRLRELECPGLGHRYLLEKAEVRELPEKRKILILNGMEQYNHLGKVERLDFQRNIVNLGKTITGEYQILFALYNHKQKRVLSNQVISPHVIELGNETRQAIKGCENLETPMDKSNTPGSLENFKFGR